MHMGKGTDALYSFRGFKAFFHLLPLKFNSDAVDYMLDIYLILYKNVNE